MCLPKWVVIPVVVWEGKGVSCYSSLGRLWFKCALAEDLVMS